jgi:murein DD-endopeptidase MepM/ murein hydrolase activator NlpD
VSEGSGQEERRLTLIIVPHGDLETRSYEVPYRRLKIALGFGVAVLLVIGFVVASWFPVAAQAGRVPGLVRELEELEIERAKVGELAKTLEEVEAQYERVRALLGTDGANTDSTPAMPPLRGTDANPFGATATPSLWPLDSRGFITREQQHDERRDHPGLDIATPANAVIRATGSGVVIRAEDDDVYGNYIILDHGNGIESLYGHAARVFVRVGERVSRGQVIALTGSTGQSSAPHLHFEIRQNGRAVDPLNFVRQP